MSKEDSCFFVSSRGILKSCDRHNPRPQSSSAFLDPTIYSNIQPYNTVYLCTEAIPNFIETYLPGTKVPFCIVSGDSDLTFPDDILPSWKQVIEDPRILHWYAQNCTVVGHTKITQIPIGLDYHTLSEISADESHPWGEKKEPIEQEEELIRYRAIEPNLKRRVQKAYGNFLQNIGRGNRREAVLEIPRLLVLYERDLVPRKTTWWKQASCAFTISPHGNGLDCHRTWETLALGGIAVVKTSALDSLYEGLPVLILQKWSDFTEELVAHAMEGFAFSSPAFSSPYERLSLKYWITKIKSHSK